LIISLLPKTRKPRREAGLTQDIYISGALNGLRHSSHPRRSLYILGNSCQIKKWITTTYYLTSRINPTPHPRGGEQKRNPIWNARFFNVLNSARPFVIWGKTKNRPDGHRDDFQFSSGEAL